MAKTLSDLQRFMLRRAAEHRITRGKPGEGADLPYAEVLRKFYRLPRSAFPELRAAEAAISRSVSALKRRRLVVVVHQSRHRAGINLTDAGLARARLIPPSRMLPRAKRKSTTAESMRDSTNPLLRGYLIGSEPPDRELVEELMEERSERALEQINKAGIRRRAAARLRWRPVKDCLI